MSASQVSRQGQRVPRVVGLRSAIEASVKGALRRPRPTGPASTHRLTNTKPPGKRN